MLSPVLCGASVNKIMEPIKSTSHLSRVKTMLSSSPLGRRRHGSSGNIPAAITADTKLASSSRCGLVWGVSLDKLVNQNKSKHQVPFIVEKIVEYVEKHGLCQEGLYRVNGNAKVIEKLKVSFDKTGDAKFDNVDIAALGGLLKQFLRDIPIPLITDDIVEKFVELNDGASSYNTRQYYEQIRKLVKELPPNRYHLLRYLVNHLVIVAKHEDDNKMSPVSLSIVFGPNVFRCEGGLAGLQRQGVCNAFLSKMIMRHDKVFMEDDKAWANQVKEEAVQRREKPQKPLPYSVYMENLNNTKEFNDSCDILSSSCGHGSLTSPAFIVTTDDVANERNIDECVANSPPASHELSESYEFSRSCELSRSHDSDPDLGTGQFVREVGIRRRPSLEVVKKKSLSPPREEELPRTPSPWSQISNSSISPASSPIQATSHVMSQYLALVIEQTVRQLLYGPGKSYDAPPPTIPTIATTKPMSSARQRRKVSTGSKGSRNISSDAKNGTKIDIKNNTTESEGHSSIDPVVTSEADASMITDDSTGGTSNRRVIMRRGSSKEEQDRKRFNRESGALFCDSINIMDHSVDQTDGNTESSQLEDVIGQVKPHQKKKPTVKGFELFESLGLVMGAPMSRRSNDSKPLQTIATVSADDNNCRHFVMTSLESHDEEDSLSQSTGAYSVKLATTSLNEDDLNAVKTTANTLDHPTMSRSHGPADRRLPRSRIRSAPSLGSAPHLTSANNSVPDIAAVTNRSKPVPFPKPKPRHHKDDAGKANNLTSDLHTTTSDLHTKTTSDLHTKTASDLHPKTTSDSHTTISDSHSDIVSDRHFKPASDLHSKASTDPLTHAKSTTGRSTRAPKLKAKSISESDHSTDAAVTAVTIKTTNDQTKSKVVDKSLTTDTDFQTKNTKATSNVQSYHIDVNTDDNDHTNAKLQARAHTKVTDDRSTTSGGSQHVNSHTKATSDGDPHTTTELCTAMSDNNFHTKTSDKTATKHTLDVVSDHLVEETNVGWAPSHTANDEAGTELQRRLKEIKRSVREYENSYKAEHGIKPTGTEKDPIRPLLKEYFSIKRQLQQSMLSLADSTSDEVLSKTAPAKLSEPQDPNKTTDQDSDEIKSKQAALIDCQQILADNRQKSGRPDNVDHMSTEQLQEEKLSVQRVLLAFEKQHGRPQSDHEREVMRPLYNYYRQLKKIISGRGSTSNNKCDLTLTTVSMAAPVQDNKVDSDSLCGSLRRSNDLVSSNNDTAAEVTTSQPYILPSSEGVVPSSNSVEELKEQLDIAKDEKRKLRLIIQEHETEFEQQHGRPMKDKEDKQPILHHHEAYKRIKAHIKLIETLMAKKDSNVTV